MISGRGGEHRPGRQHPRGRAAGPTNSARQHHKQGRQSLAGQTRGFLRILFKTLAGQVVVPIRTDKCAVIGGLAAGIEDQIEAKLVPAAEPALPVTPKVQHAGLLKHPCQSSYPPPLAFKRGALVEWQLLTTSRSSAACQGLHTCHSAQTGSRPCSS